MTEYLLKDGSTVIIREVELSDAEQMIFLMKQADSETEFLAREPGEFPCMSLSDSEKQV